MNKIIVALGLLLSTSAFAAKTDAPKGTGNFRRAEVVRAAGAKSDSAYVMGMATSGRFINGTNDHVLSRVQVVSSGGKVTLVKAPINKAAKVTKLTATEAQRYGLITQAKARQKARFGGGVYASKGVVLKDAGLAGSSYNFRQVAPATISIKDYGNDYTVSKISRTVTITGSGESASGVKTRVKPLVLTPNKNK